MAELKTKPGAFDSKRFLGQIVDPGIREDSATLLEMLARITGEPPVLWGDRVVGFGSYEYLYASGRSGTWFRVGFAPRGRKFTIYVMSGFAQLKAELEHLGRYKLGKGCLYVNKLADIDLSVLERLLAQGYKLADSPDYS